VRIGWVVQAEEKKTKGKKVLIRMIDKSQMDVEDKRKFYSIVNSAMQIVRLICNFRIITMQ
jgi:hypothetical protein